VLRCVAASGFVSFAPVVGPCPVVAPWGWGNYAKRIDGEAEIGRGSVEILGNVICDCHEL